MNERDNETLSVPSDGATVETKLLRIALIAKNDSKLRFNNIFHLMSKDLLRICFKKLRSDAAAGIDDVTKQGYAKNLEANLDLLVSRLHAMSYRPQAVKRVYIPKANGKLRPLGIPTLEDKLVQSAMVRILEKIYEQDFLECSHGFRPKRNCHQALAIVMHTIEREKVNFVVEAGIKGFFDAVDHTWLVKFLEHRIADKRMVRMVVRFLKAGVMEEGKLHEVDEGTPQGGIISPLLANIYLHYVLDLWFEKRYRKSCQGYSKLIRYADDFIVCFQNQGEAHAFMQALKERMAQFGLELAEDKTKIIRFGRFAGEQEKARGGVKPETFDFLGFTHYCARSRGGKHFRVKRITARKKRLAKEKEFTAWLKKSRTLPTNELLKTVVAKARGHNQYYGVSDNMKAVNGFLYKMKTLLHKWLNRRGRRRCYTWKRLVKTLNRISFPKAKIKVNLYAM